MIYKYKQTDIDMYKFVLRIFFKTYFDDYYAKNDAACGFSLILCDTNGQYNIYHMVYHLINTIILCYYSFVKYVL